MSVLRVVRPHICHGLQSRNRSLVNGIYVNRGACAPVSGDCALARIWFGPSHRKVEAAPNKSGIEQRPKRYCDVLQRSKCTWSDGFQHTQTRTNKHGNRQVSAARITKGNDMEAREDRGVVLSADSFLQPHAGGVARHGDKSCVLHRSKVGHLTRDHLHSPFTSISVAGLATQPDLLALEVHQRAELYQPTLPVWGVPFKNKSTCRKAFWCGSCLHMEGFS